MATRAKPTEWLYFLNLFLARSRRLEPEIAKITNLTQKQSQLIGRSLSIFQAGEAGEGRLAKEIRSHNRSFIDGNYRQACALFVKEEGRHGRILAQILRALSYQEEGTIIANNLFIFTRRSLGITFKLLVLLVAELVGLLYYSYLAALLRDEQLALLLEDICSDEADHLLFHLNYFHLLINENKLFCLFYVPASFFIGITSFAFVAIEHRQSMTCTGGSPRIFFLQGLRAAFKLSECMLKGQRPAPSFRRQMSIVVHKRKA